MRIFRSCTHPERAWTLRDPSFSPFLFIRSKRRSRAPFLDTGNTRSAEWEANLRRTVYEERCPGTTSMAARRTLTAGRSRLHQQGGTTTNNRVLLQHPLRKRGRPDKNTRRSGAPGSTATRMRYQHGKSRLRFWGSGSTGDSILTGQAGARERLNQPPGGGDQTPILRRVQKPQPQGSRAWLHGMAPPGAFPSIISSSVTGRGGRNTGSGWDSGGIRVGHCRKREKGAKWMGARRKWLPLLCEKRGGRTFCTSRQVPYLSRMECVRIQKIWTSSSTSRVFSWRATACSDTGSPSPQSRELRPCRGRTRARGTAKPAGRAP